MATYSVPAGTSTITETLTASTVDTVTFADRFRYIFVNQSGVAGTIMITTDGTTPTVTGIGSGVSVGANEQVVIANGGQSWYQTAKVIKPGTLIYPTGGGTPQTNTTANNQPGEVQPFMSSLAGGVANPGTVVKLISSAATTYTITGAG